SERAQKVRQVGVGCVTGAAQVLIFDAVEEFGKCEGPAGALAIEKEKLGNVFERHADQMAADDEPEAVEPRGLAGRSTQGQETGGRAGDAQQAQVTGVLVGEAHGRQTPRRLERMNSTRRSVSGVGISASMRARASASFRPQ